MTKDEIKALFRSLIPKLEEMEKKLDPIWEQAETEETREVGNEAWERVTSLIEYMKHHSNN